MGSSDLVEIEAELSPGSIEEWLSVVKDRKMMRRRSDLAVIVKKHLSALGWCFFYAQKKDRRELRYKSPNGKVFYSLATACMSLVDQNPEENLQIVPIYDVACAPGNRSSSSNLDSSKRKRKRFDTHESTSKVEKCKSNLMKIVPCVDVSKKKRKSERFDTRESTPKAKNCKSDLMKIVPCVDASKTKRKSERFNTHESTPNEEKCKSDLMKIVPCVDASKTKRKSERFNTHESTPKAENSKSDLMKLVPCVDASKKKRRFDTHESTSKAEKCKSDLMKIVPCFDVFDERPKKKKKMKRLEDIFDAPVFKGQTFIEEKIKINHDVVRAKQQQKKKKKSPSVGKSLKRILQAKEKKQKMDKSEKESQRFWRKDCGPEKNCDVCCVCHWGGDLILCDGCPSSFHHACLGLSSLPEEDPWFCPRCCCENCGSVESPENSKLMTCEQCQKRFHFKCLKEEPCIVSCAGWFCSFQCHKVFASLQKLIGRKIVVGDGGDLVWTLMRAPNEYEQYGDEQKSKLDSAVEILHKGFEPSKDPFTGRDIVEELVFGRDANGMARGFYTVLIEKKNEPITVATVRVEKDLVEIPLVATLPEHRKSGMCRVLMDELEKQMSQIGVYRLVLPAIQEVLATWTQRFGFSVMESSERLKLVRHGTLDFLGTTMCHKFLPRERGGEDSTGKSSLVD